MFFIFFLFFLLNPTLYGLHNSDSIVPRQSPAELFWRQNHLLLQERRIALLKLDHVLDYIVEQSRPAFIEQPFQKYFLAKTIYQYIEHLFQTKSAMVSDWSWFFLKSHIEKGLISQNTHHVFYWLLDPERKDLLTYCFDQLRSLEKFDLDLKQQKDIFYASFPADVDHKKDVLFSNLIQQIKKLDFFLFKENAKYDFIWYFQKKF